MSAPERVKQVTENFEQRVVMGVSRLSKIHDGDEARLSILIADPFQGLGIGSELVKRMIDVGKGERLKRILATFTPENKVMQRIFQKLGFSLAPTEDGKLRVAVLEL